MQPTELRGMVNRIANWLGEDAGDDINAWAGSDGKDMGLDLLFYRPFPDNRAGFPVYISCSVRAVKTGPRRYINRALISGRGL